MRIGIDARFFGTLGKGLGRYTQKLIENLEKIDHQNQYFIFLRKANWNDYQPKNNNFTKVLADIPWYGFREQFLFPRRLKAFNLDLVHFPHFNVPFAWKGKFIVTIHDLILIRYPTKKATTLSPLTYFLKKKAYQFVISRAAKKSERIIAVSQWTKKDILEHFQVPPEKILVTHEAVDTLSRTTSESKEGILAKYGIIRPYLLYVGNAYPHKNLERLISVFKDISRRHPHLHLVLVGKEDYFYKRLKNFVNDNSVKNVIFADHVADEHLGVVYKEALLYVFPSFYEGFGLPPLEAMARNIPVVSSNASCLPEILGSAAYYFDPNASAEMAEKIEKVLIDHELRKRLIDGGYQQLKKYSWEKMAKQTLEIYSGSRP